MIQFQFNDGGRKNAGFKGETGDCACRVIAIATGKSYQEIYDLIMEYGKKERLSKRKSGKSHPRTGVYINTMKKLMKDLGFEWITAMTIGSGCTMHLKTDELPMGTLICRLSKHYATVIDGVLHDVGNCSRNGTRCVYGYWRKK